MNLAGANVETGKGGGVTQIQIVVNQQVAILAENCIQMIDVILRSTDESAMQFVVEDPALDLTWKEFTHMMQREVLRYWLSTGLTNTEIADRLDLQRTYVSRKIGEWGLEGESRAWKKIRATERKKLLTAK